MVHITPEIINFLEAISKNNSREWYQDNKKDYQKARADFVAFTNALIEGMRQHQDMGSVQAKDCMFRINRDVRFSKDKTPYNSHMSAYITPEGKKTKLAGFFFRIKPDGESLIGGGFWNGDGPTLAAIRQEIDYSAQEFRGIIEDPKFVERFGALRGDQLKRPPKGYDADHPEIELLKHKQWLAWETLSKQQYASPQFLAHVLDSYERMLPLINFINRTFD